MWLQQESGNTYIQHSLGQTAEQHGPAMLLKGEPLVLCDASTAEEPLERGGGVDGGGRHHLKRLLLLLHTPLHLPAPLADLTDTRSRGEASEGWHARST